MTAAALPPYGQQGVLRTTADAVQCHGCGEWFANLAAHTYPAHGLTAGDYRQTFGLMQRTKLTAPNLWADQSKRARDHLIEIGEPHREAIKHVPTEERRRRAKQAERRVEHELNATAPERTRPIPGPRWQPALDDVQTQTGRRGMAPHRDRQDRCPHLDGSSGR